MCDKNATDIIFVGNKAKCKVSEEKYFYYICSWKTIRKKEAPAAFQANQRVSSSTKQQAWSRKRILISSSSVTNSYQIDKEQKNRDHLHSNSQLRNIV